MAMFERLFVYAFVKSLTKTEKNTTLLDGTWHGTEASGLK